MKVLFICHNLTGGGAERVCVGVANGLSMRGHNITIMTDIKSPVTYKPLPAVKVVSSYIGVGWLKRRILPMFYLMKYFKKERPDVVVCILYVYAEQAKLASLLTIHCPIIISDHNAFERMKYPRMELKREFHKFYSNYFFDGLTVLTEVDKKLLKGRFKNVCVMPNPLAFTPLEEIPAKENLILAVGRLNDWNYKGFDLLIEGWKIICKKHPDWKLRIVGHGDKTAKEFLTSLTESIPNIEFKSYTSNILEEYRKASIFVLSSRREGFGLVLTEAMSQGCACIACDYKGRQSEIIKDGTDGLLCPTEDSKAIADKIDLLINDFQLREQLQKNALKNLSRFSIDNISIRWEKFLYNIPK